MIRDTQDGLLCAQRATMRVDGAARLAKATVSLPLIGRCPRLVRRVVIVLVALTGSAMLVAHGETVPPKGNVDGRIRAVPYNRDEVYRLHGLIGWQIHLEFERGETFVGLSAGDLEAVTYGAEGNNFFLKPRAAIVSTNLTLITTRRTYHFEYSASAKRPTASDELIYSVRFVYPASGEDASQQAAERIAAALASNAAPGPHNTDYWYCGHKSLKPLSASDNGVHTRLRFPPQSDWPAVFVRHEDGVEALLNFTVRDGELIIHRVAREFILRRGKLTGCVVNRGFSGGSDRLPSGTVAPDVDRRIRSIEP